MEFVLGSQNTAHCPSILVPGETLTDIVSDGTWNPNLTRYALKFSSEVSRLFCRSGVKALLGTKVNPSVALPDLRFAIAWELSFVGELSLSKSTAHSRISWGTLEGSFCRMDTAS